MRTVIPGCLAGKQKPAGRTAAIVGWIYATMIASTKTDVRMITRPCSLTYSG